MRACMCVCVRACMRACVCVQSLIHHLCSGWSIIHVMVYLVMCSSFVFIFRFTWASDIFYLLHLNCGTDQNGQKYDQHHIQG